MADIRRIVSSGSLTKSSYLTRMYRGPRRRESRISVIALRVSQRSATAEVGCGSK